MLICKFKHAGDWNGSQTPMRKIMLLLLNLTFFFQKKTIIRSLHDAMHNSPEKNVPAIQARADQNLFTILTCHSCNLFHYKNQLFHSRRAEKSKEKRIDKYIRHHLIYYFSFMFIYGGLCCSRNWQCLTLNVLTT